MVNRVILIGNLGQDPEIRSLENGAQVAKFSVATNENYKDKSGEWQTLTEWHDVVAWRGLADRASKQLKKGVTVYIEGKLTHRKWEDSNGNPRKTTEVVANYFRAINRRDDDRPNTGGYFPSAQDEVSASNSGNTGVAETKVETEPAADDDLPF